MDAGSFNLDMAEPMEPSAVGNCRHPEEVDFTLLVVPPMMRQTVQRTKVMNELMAVDPSVVIRAHPGRRARRRTTVPLGPS